MHLHIYSETCIDRTLNKLESCINRTLYKVPMWESFVNLTSINRTPFYYEDKSWTRVGLISLYATPQCAFCSIIIPFHL
jgi:hypothetical protein